MYPTIKPWHHFKSSTEYDKQFQSLAQAIREYICYFVISRTKNLGSLAKEFKSFSIFFIVIASFCAISLFLIYWLQAAKLTNRPWHTAVARARNQVLLRAKFFSNILVAMKKERSLRRNSRRNSTILKNSLTLRTFNGKRRRVTIFFNRNNWRFEPSRGGWAV